LSRPHRTANAPARATTAAACHPLCARARLGRAAELASSGAPVEARTRAPGAAREAAPAADARAPRAAASAAGDAAAAAAVEALPAGPAKAHLLAALEHYRAAEAARQADEAEASLTLSPEQAVFNRRLFVLNLTVCAGYWREVNGCIGACREFATDTAKDGLLHLTMFYAARDAAKARTAYAWAPWLLPQQLTRLHQAARAGLAGRVAVLVAAGADVNARDMEGRTALFWASERGHTAVVTALLACPGINNVNVADVRGWTPLSLASYNGNTAVVTALLACPGVDANAVAGTRSLNAASVGGGNAPLYWASYEGHTAVVGALLAHPGILVNAVTTNTVTTLGGTPLKIAKFFGHAEVVALLVAAGGVQ